MISPPYLQRGDTVCIISTARKISKNEIAASVNLLTEWGLNVITSPNLFAEHHQFAGTDDERLEDLIWAINNPDIKAILCARGGYGTSRILDHIDLSPLFQQPKWIIGFSDVTALHLHLHVFGIESIHAVMPVVFSKPNSEESIESLKNVMFGKPISYSFPSNPLNRNGEAKGQLIGGNLSLVNHLIGTASEPDWSGKILFIEDIDEYLYHIDRMMVQLKRSGILKLLAGFVIGHFTDMKDNSVPFGLNAYEIIKEHVSEYNFPVAFGFPMGHEAKNLAVICGRETALTVNESRSFLLQLKS